jgi:hypothetical protein
LSIGQKPKLKLEKSKMVVVNLTPKQSGDEKQQIQLDQTSNNKSIAHNNATNQINNNNNNNNSKSIDLIEQILNENNFNSNNNTQSNKSLLNASKLNDQFQQQHQQQQQHMLDQTPVSTSSKSKMERSGSNNNLIDANNNSQRLSSPLNYVILNEKASCYYNDVLNKNSNVQRQHSTNNGKGLKVTNLTEIESVDPTIDSKEIVINMEAEELRHVGGREKEQIKVMHMRHNEAYESDTEKIEAARNNLAHDVNGSANGSSRKVETFYDGSRTWTAVTDAE